MSLSIINSAFLLLKRRGFGYEAKRPGKTWFYAFLKRNKLAFRKPESISKASACLTQSDIESWFKKIFDYISGKDVPGDSDKSSILEDPSRCYNADESFFLLNPSYGRVIVPKGTENVFEVKDGSEKEGVTVMACFGADGEIVKPAIIRSSFPPSLHLSCSKSG